MKPVIQTVFLAVVVGTVIAFPGSNKVRPLIVGGQDAERDEAPYMVHINLSGKLHCGGAVIQRQWIITGANCMQEPMESYRIVAGDYNLDEDEGIEQTRGIIQVLFYPGEDPDLIEKDIAIVQLDAPLNMGPQHKVDVATLAPEGTVPSGTLTVYGWGRLSEGANMPSVLQKVTPPLVDDETCKKAYGEFAISETMMCAGAPGFDFCYGDAGGPLMCDIDGSSYICGLASWGEGCARPDFPGVYTEVSHFTNWIYFNVPIGNN